VLEVRPRWMAREEQSNAQRESAIGTLKILGSLDEEILSGPIYHVEAITPIDTIDQTAIFHAQVERRCPFWAASQSAIYYELINTRFTKVD